MSTPRTDTPVAGLGIPTLRERYRLDRAVARGSSSLVYRGTDLEEQQQVAIKVLTARSPEASNAHKRFMQEARLASQLEHPTVAQILDFGRDPKRNVLFIVMEWVEGQSVWKAVREDGAMDARQAAEVGLCVARALGAAHGSGFLHRDLKPSNVMLVDAPGRGPEAKVLDFGLAKVRANSTQPEMRITADGMFVGTPRYAPPEQLRGDELTPAADFYCLGMLLWEALVGEPAVPATDYGSCLKYHLDDAPWRLPAEANVPGALASVIHRILAKDPADRCDNATEVTCDLRSFLLQYGGN